MQSKENNSNYSTKLAHPNGFRKLQDMTNYDTLKQYTKQDHKPKPIQQLGKLPDVKFFQPKTQKYVAYPCYNEKYLDFPKEMAGKLKKRQQDDDCETDEEVQQHSTEQNINELLKALSQINGKAYNIGDYLK